jgi:large subunit ribosomal protein L15
MRLHELRPPKDAVKKERRVGRGQASGRGGTSGRGHKGQKARSGGNIRPGFEGGQTPLYQRLPKLPGFKNPFRKIFTTVNAGKLDVFNAGSVVNPKVMLQRGMVKKGLPIKILGEGEITKALTVRAHAFSKAAVEKIEKAGGKAEVIS